MNIEFTLDDMEEEEGVFVMRMTDSSVQIIYDTIHVGTIKAKDLIAAAKAIEALLKEQEPRTLRDNRVKIGNHYAHNVDHIIMTGC